MKMTEEDKAYFREWYHYTKDCSTLDLKGALEYATVRQHEIRKELKQLAIRKRVYRLLLSRRKDK